LAAVPVTLDHAVRTKNFRGAERRLAIHLASQNLAEIAFCRQRQRHCLAQHVRFGQPQHRFAGWARHSKQISCRQVVPAKGMLSAIASQANRYCLGHGTDRGNHQRVVTRWANPAPFLGDAIGKLSSPPGQELADHSPRPSLAHLPPAPCFILDCRPILERRRELFDRFRQVTMNSGTKRLKPKLLLSTVRE
jgi:hypothetical protein